jgi:hypothetical protein
MAQDLTTSQIDRQNILNNKYALQTIRENLDIKFVNFKGTLYVTKQMTAVFFEVDVRTLSRIIKANEAELTFNGYKTIQANELKEFKLQFDKDIDVPIKTVRLGLFDFRSFLNIGMLLTTSEKAKKLRAMMLDVVIATINNKTGGGTKYINWRDRDFLPAAIQEEDYHKKFTSAIKANVAGNATGKYGEITNMIYKAVFCEHADEYRALLKLNPTDNVRRTLYTEVLRVISSFENALADAIKKMAEDIERKVSMSEVQRMVNDIAKSPLMEPFMYEARQKMASRDQGFRQVTHEELLGYMKALSPEEFDRFLGDKSVDLEKLLLESDENRDILQTLN